MVVTDKGKVLKPISAREKTPAKERWKAATKGGKGNSSIKDSLTTKDKQEVEGEPTMNEEKVEHAKTGDLKQETAPAKEVEAKKPVPKMRWKEAVAKQGVKVAKQGGKVAKQGAGRNGYNPIMTDHGVMVVRKDSNGSLKPTKTSEKKDDEPIINDCNNVTKIKEKTTGNKDFLGNGLDEVDGTEFNQHVSRITEAVKENQKASMSKHEYGGIKDLTEKDKVVQDVPQQPAAQVVPQEPAAQRPSSLKLWSQHKQQVQGTQDQHDMSNNVDNKQQDKDKVTDNKQKDAKDLSTNMWMKEKELGDPQVSWTSWQEMAEKKCPTKNLIVFN